MSYQEFLDRVQAMARTCREGTEAFDHDQEIRTDWKREERTIAEEEGAWEGGN